MTLIEIFWWMVCGHFVADITFQPDFVAKFKARSASIPAIPWYYVLTSHAATHAVAVALVTGSVLIGSLELVAHWIIDAAKCEGLTGIHTDQTLHMACKVAWLSVFCSMA